MKNTINNLMQMCSRKLYNYQISIVHNFKQFVRNHHHLLKAFIIILLINIIAIYPIINVNFNYLDDLSRVINGSPGFKGFSRYTSEYLSIFIHTSRKLTDISPLPQLIAVLFSSLTCTIILYLFKKDKKINLSTIIATIPLSICPYFLECLSYKYDAPYMALSILASVVPFVFYTEYKKYNISYIIALIIGTIVMCTTYQASSGIVPVLALFIAFWHWLKSDKKAKKTFKNILVFLILTVIGYLTGLLIFRLFIMNSFNNYVSSSIFSLKELIPGYITNLTKYYTYVLSDFRNLWKLLVCITILFFVGSQTVRSKHNKIVTLVLSIILILLSLLLIFGVYPFLTSPLFAARSMYGIGVLISLICITITDNKWLISPSKIVVIALSWCFFTFTFTYGNALSAQQDYIDFRVQNVINGLNELEIMNNDTIKIIKINGSIGKAPEIANINDGYKSIINRLVQQSFGSSSWVWNYIYFVNYFKIKNIKVSNADYSGDIELEVYQDTMYYTIETNYVDYILITLK